MCVCFCVCVCVCVCVCLSVCLCVYVFVFIAQQLPSLAEDQTYQKKVLGSMQIHSYYFASSIKSTGILGLQQNGIFIKPQVYPLFLMLFV